MGRVFVKVLQNRNQRGFSLFEMLAVLIIIGILAALVGPATGRYMDNLSFRQQTRKFMKTLRYARLAAVSSAKSVKVRLADSDDCIFELSGGVNETQECTLGLDEELSLEPNEIVFYPEGYSTHAIMVFSREQRKKTITMDMLTAMPILE